MITTGNENFAFAALGNKTIPAKFFIVNSDTKAMSPKISSHEDWRVASNSPYRAAYMKIHHY